MGGREGGRRKERRDDEREGGALLCNILHYCPSYHKKYFDSGLAPVVLGCFKLLQNVPPSQQDTP